MKKKKVIVVGSGSDMAKTTINIIKNNFDVIKLNSKNFDLSKKYNKKFINFDFDHLIFFSAINNKKEFTKFSDEEIIEHYNINFLNLSLFLKEIIPIFKRKKIINKIILTSSLYSNYGRSQRLPYSTSKFALNGLGKNLAVEYGKYGIITNIVIPGFVDTKLTSKNVNYTNLKKIILKTPTKKLITKKQVAEVIKFLLSDKSNGINGQEIVIDGGLSSNGDFS